MTGQPERDLRAQVKAALTTACISQAEAARQLGLSAKHMSHMLTGRATLTLDWADRILTLCGMTLAVAVIPGTGQARPTQPRIPLDDLTSDALDALYDRLDRVRNAWQESRARWWKANARIDELDARVRGLEADNAHYEEVVVGDLNEANIGLQRQAAHSEATVARVRQAVDAGPVGSCCAHLIHAALNPPTGLTPEEREAADAYAAKLNTPPSAATLAAIAERIADGTAPRRKVRRRAAIDSPSDTAQQHEAP